MSDSLVTYEDGTPRFDFQFASQFDAEATAMDMMLYNHAAIRFDEKRLAHHIPWEHVRVASDDKVSA